MFSDALDREAAWLRAVDDLPPLLGINGGPFAVVQARLPRTPAKSKPSLFVVRQTQGSKVSRFAAQRQIMTHAIRLIIDWPILTGTGRVEQDWLDAEQATDRVIARVLGHVGDHTHGGRFLSAAEGVEGVIISPDDPEAPSRVGGFRVRIDYTVDDQDQAG